MPQLHDYKRAARLANVVVSALTALLLVIGILAWIVQEALSADHYQANTFLDNPKFRQGRIILFTTYFFTLAFLVIIQTCIQIAKDPHDDHIRARRMVWGITGSLIVLCYMAVALLAGTYKTQDLSRLNDEMRTELSKPFYEFYPNETSEAGAKFESVQKKLKCCGVEGPADFGSVLVDYGMAVPYSCCELKKGQSNDPIQPEDVKNLTECIKGVEGKGVFQDGCADIMIRSTENMTEQLVAIGSFAAIAVSIAIILRLSLGYAYQTMKKKSPRNYEVSTAAEPVPLVERNAPVA